MQLTFFKFCFKTKELKNTNYLYFLFYFVKKNQNESYTDCFHTPVTLFLTVLLIWQAETQSRKEASVNESSTEWHNSPAEIIPEAECVIWWTHIKRLHVKVKTLSSRSVRVNERLYEGSLNEPEEVLLRGCGLEVRPVNSKRIGGLIPPVSGHMSWLNPNQKQIQFYFLTLEEPETINEVKVVCIRMWHISLLLII